jgi:nitrous oxide reductase accessory protein NosL
LVTQNNLPQHIGKHAACLIKNTWLLHHTKPNTKVKLKEDSENVWHCDM